MVWKILLLLLAFGVVLYLLYCNGYVVTQAKRAVLYAGSLNGKSASFTSCTGFTRRVFRCKESRTYHFVFAPALTKGDVAAALLDADRQTLLRLQEDMPRGHIALERGKRYYLELRFQSASGKYTLDWE